MAMNIFFLGRSNTIVDISLFLVRAISGLIIFVAGAGKVFGWFGGYGLQKTLEAFSSMMHTNAFWAYVSCFTELIGGFLLMIGLFTRPAAFFVAINMFVATNYVGWENFFSKTGDFPFTLFICSFVILLCGPGSLSFDALLFRPKKKQGPRSWSGLQFKI